MKTTLLGIALALLLPNLQAFSTEGQSPEIESYIAEKEIFPEQEELGTLPSETDEECDLQKKPLKTNKSSQRSKETPCKGKEEKTEKKRPSSKKQ